MSQAPMSQAPMSSDVTSDDKLWTLLAYILSPIVPIILMLMEDKKNRPFIKAHNAQALALGVYSGGPLCSPRLVILYRGLPRLITLDRHDLLGHSGIQGKYVTIPVISDFVKNQGWVKNLNPSSTKSLLKSAGFFIGIGKERIFFLLTSLSMPHTMGLQINGLQGRDPM